MAVVTLFLPAWMVFLPAVAFDAGLAAVDFCRLSVRWSPRPRVADSAPRRAWSVPAQGARGPEGHLPPALALAAAPSLAWLLPACADLVRFTGLWRRYALLALLASALAAYSGLVYRRLDRARSQLLHSVGPHRYTVRQLRSRISELDEEQARSVRTARLSERTRIAREIHDNVGHLLTRAIMQAQAFQVVAQAQGEERAAGDFADLGATLDEAMTTIRRSVHDLEDEGTDFSAQIEAAATVPSGMASGDLRVSVTNDITAAPAPVARCFATVIREALSNTIRHSDASTASVVLRDHPAFWQLVVQDDGSAITDQAGTARVGNAGTDERRAHGFRAFAGVVAMPSDPAERWRGMGLADIEARAKALGGSALTGPYGRGWRVFVSLPKGPWRDKLAGEGAAEGESSKEAGR
ncbi:two-component sensor histidine kinase [Bifidobacterium xylocopae]|uniref:histidine kinase n=2 Tax=Bifidobacterium xylocopae TaxID=2493119 RepID=A0A366KDU1_9BIFI|nr:two-component sensor histidine kinase [Bifidobacterium xylocopae]